MLFKFSVHISQCVVIDVTPVPMAVGLIIQMKGVDISGFPADKLPAALSYVISLTQHHLSTAERSRCPCGRERERERERERVLLQNLLRTQVFFTSFLKNC